jgi:histidinol-phosphate aminotransferase
MFDALSLARPNIRDLEPYSSAREDFCGTADVFLDANENSLGSPIEGQFNRYPDPLQREIKELLSKRDNVAANSIFVGNGSDEAIDLLLRVFCEPGKDEIIICPPTYGMYKVAADINDVSVKLVPLDKSFQLETRAILDALTPTTKLIFICSPNNPSGNAMNPEDITIVAREADAIVVIDEAYAEFADASSLVAQIKRLPNILILRTLSKAYGLAAARIGIAYADTPIIDLLNKAKPPYNVSGIAQEVAVKALRAEPNVETAVRTIRDERERLSTELRKTECVDTVFPSDANFLLVRVTDARRIYDYLIGQNIVVRDRSREHGCENGLRITVGTSEENDRLLAVLRAFTEKEATA